MKQNFNKFPTVEEIQTKIFQERPVVKRSYDKLAPKYDLIAKTIKARIKKGLTQKEIADRMGTKQSALARFESGNTNPTLEFIQRLAKALNTTFKITIS